MLPNFMCIGAQKSGTTTLWHILNAHPDIFMAPVRETRFFYDDLLYAEGLSAYEVGHYAAWAGQAIAGEKCPEYLCADKVPERIFHALGPEIRFIVSLRSPAQRAFSQYRHNLARLREYRSFDEALTQAHSGYIDRGCYAEQLLRYFDLFDQDRFLILHFETDICGDQKDLTARLYDFLGVDRHTPEGSPFKEGHPSLKQMSMTLNTDHEDPDRHFVEIDRQDRRLRLAREMLARAKSLQTLEHADVQRIYRPSESLRRLVRNFRSHKPSGSYLPRDQELAINHRYFETDIKALQPLIPFDISRWLTDR